MERSKERQQSHLSKSRHQARTSTMAHTLHESHNDAGKPAEDGYHVRDVLYDVAAGVCGLDLPPRQPPTAGVPLRSPTLPPRSPSLTPGTSRGLRVPGPGKSSLSTRTTINRPHSFSGLEGLPDLLPKPRPFSTMLHRQGCRRKVKRIRFGKLQVSLPCIKCSPLHSMKLVMAYIILMKNVELVNESDIFVRGGVVKCMKQLLQTFIRLSVEVHY